MKDKLTILEKTLKETDPEVYKSLQNEILRQEQGIELIASENATSLSIMQVQGSVFTNKYAEGYPSKRFYGGCEFADEVEQLAIERAKKLYGAAFANVQPHSGSQANTAIYMAELKPGDSILGMDLSQGGHLTHGAPVNFSGKVFNAHFYGIDHKTGLIDYDKVLEKAKQVQPRMIVAGASSYSRIIDFKKFREIADEVGALLFVDMAHIAGLVAAGVHPSPIEHAHYTTTTTHKTLRGPRGGLILTNSEESIKKINSIVFPGIQGGPLMHVVAAKAVAFKQALEKEFQDYQKKIVENAKHFAKVFNDLNYNIISGGTDNHLILVNLVNKNVTGKALQTTLDKALITLNKNVVPNDPKSAFVTSGVRIGTPTITTRGMGKAEVEKIALWIDRVVKNIEDETTISDVRKEVIELTKKFPLYRSL